MLNMIGVLENFIVIKTVLVGLLTLLWPLNPASRGLADNPI